MTDSPQRFRTRFADPPPGMVSVDLTAEVWERFRKLAVERGVSRQALLGEFLMEGIQKAERQAVVKL